MKVLKASLWVAIGVVGLGLVGCDVQVSNRHHHDDGYAYVQPQPQYAQPQPVYVQPQPQYVEPQPQYVIVQQAPPPIIVETRPPQPSGLSVWIGGSWNWSNQRYNWQAGRYATPPEQGAIWIAPRYERDTHRYTQGQWQKQQHNNNGHNQGHDNH